jgi:hypothetical protein
MLLPMTLTLNCPQMTNLSPAAQAVLDATGRKTWYRNDDIAAALRAAADQVVPELGRPRTADERTLYHEGRLDAVIRHRQQLLAIADELEDVKYGTYRSPLKTK